MCGPKVLKTMALNLVWVFLLANTVAHGVERFCVFVMFAVMMDSVLTMSFFTAVMVCCFKTLCSLSRVSIYAASSFRI